MRVLSMAAVTLTCALLAGCSISANGPSSTLQTDKTPEQYVDCIVPKLKDYELSVSHSERSSRIVVSSKVTVDKVLETYKARNGGKVYLYERQLLASSLTPSSIERAALECL
jgi:hypothetical protein